MWSEDTHVCLNLEIMLLLFFCFVSLLFFISLFNFDFLCFNITEVDRYLVGRVPCERNSSYSSCFGLTLLKLYKRLNHGLWFSICF